MDFYATAIPAPVGSTGNRAFSTSAAATIFQDGSARSAAVADVWMARRRRFSSGSFGSESWDARESGHPFFSSSHPPCDRHQITARSRADGFTLIELLVTVAIIGILAAMAFPALLRAKISANEASALGSLKAINAGQAAYSSSAAPAATPRN